MYFISGHIQHSFFTFFPFIKNCGITWNFAYTLSITDKKMFNNVMITYSRISTVYSRYAIHILLIHAQDFKGFIFLEQCFHQQFYWGVVLIKNPTINNSNEQTTTDILRVGGGKGEENRNVLDVAWGNKSWILSLQSKLMSKLKHINIFHISKTRLHTSFHADESMAKFSRNKMIKLQLAILK